MASMREMAKKNLEKMVKGAAREVNTSRPASNRSGASAAPTPAKSAEKSPAKPGASKKADAAAETAVKTADAAAESSNAKTETPVKASEAAAETVEKGADTQAESAMKTAGAASESPTKVGSSETAMKAGAAADHAQAAMTADYATRALAGEEVAATPKAGTRLDTSMKAGAVSEMAADVESKTAAKAGLASSTRSEASAGVSAAGAAKAGNHAGAISADSVASSQKPSTLPPAVFEQLQAQIQKNGKTIQKVPVDSIKLNENIREAYNEEHLKTLAESMQKDGLIQFPTLCLKASANGDFTFVCKNGHRRILAAKSLGWKTIECVILPFASTRDELYHTIAANLREDVFYLDLAQAYQQANHLGESDQAIAERVGVNPRTVGWYRRLTTMAPECQALCRQYPDLFHATWAVQLARKGELPPLAILMKQMQFMLARYQALKNNADQAPQPDRLPRTIDAEQMKEAKASLKSLFSGARGSSEAQQAWQLVEQLCIAGYFKPALLNRMRRQLLPGAQKGSRRASTTES